MFESVTQAYWLDLKASRSQIRALGDSNELDCLYCTHSLIDKTKGAQQSAYPIYAIVVYIQSFSFYSFQ